MTERRLPAPWVAAAVREAEDRWYAQLSATRARTEELQASLATADFPVAFGTNASIGPFNIKPQTAREALGWAIERGLGPELGYDGMPADMQIVGDILDPQRAVVVVRALLAQLREGHPALREQSWRQIEASDELIAKLYSGYMGAGGHWEAWRRDTAPGPEALRRLDFQGSSSTVIARHRPAGQAEPMPSRNSGPAPVPLTRPVTISVLAVLTLLGGLPALLGGLLLLGLGSVLAIGEITGGAQWPGVLSLLIAAPLLLSAALALAAGAGLWLMQHWAWPLGLVTQSFAVLGNLLSLAGNGWRAVPGLLLAVGLLVYLLRPEVRRAFGR